VFFCVYSSAHALALLFLMSVSILKAAERGMLGTRCFICDIV
jgi:hypothetical protein